MKILPFLVCAALVSGCSAQHPGPSVPSKPGADLATARAAVRSCHPDAVKYGNRNLTGHYVGSVLWGGLLLGPVIIASSAQTLRHNGTLSGMDQCLEEQGYQRRDLTDREWQALAASDGYRRQVILSHLIAGGSLETLNHPQAD